MDRNHRELMMRIFAGLLLIASLGALASCGGGGGGGGSNGGGATAPGSFVLSAPSGTSVVPTPTLSWTAASGATTYSVEVSTSPAFSALTTTASAAAPTTSIVVSGLSPSTTYYWRVTATNSAGSTAATPASLQFTTKKSGEVVWSQTSDPSGIDDESYGMVFDSTRNYLYIVGYDSNTSQNDDQWRIEKRAVSDGSLVSSFGATGVVTNNPSSSTIDFFDDARAVAVDSANLYIVGFDSIPSSSNWEWRIEKRDLVTGAPVAAFGSSGAITEDINTSYNDVAHAIAIDSNPTGTIYIVGYASTPLGDTEWRIEARDKTDGGLISSVTSSLSAGDDKAYAIAIDTAEGQMYVVGTDLSFGDAGWRIEKRSLVAPLALETTTFGTGGIVQTNPSANTDEPWAIALDTTHMYIAGYMFDAGSSLFQWRIEKRFRSDGSLDAGFGTAGVVVSGPSPTTNAVARAIVIDATHMYVAGYDNTSGGDLEWRIEKRSLATGALDTTFANNGVYTNPFDTTLNLWDNIRSIVVDDAYVYVSGYESTTPVNDRWRIEKIVK